MDTDKASTVASAVTSTSALGAAIAATAPYIDPALIMALPPPYNLYVMLGLIGVAALSNFYQGYVTNKRTITSTSDSKETFIPLTK